MLRAMDLWDVHYRATSDDGSLDVGAFHIREIECEDHALATPTMVHAIADKSFAGVLCSSPSNVSNLHVYVHGSGSKVLT